MKKGWLILGAIVVLVVIVSYIYETMPGPRSRDRVATEIIVVHGDREISSSVEADCVTSVGGDWSTGRQVGVYQVGDDPFVVLPDRSILFMSMHMTSCGKGGGTRIYDGQLPYSTNVRNDGRLPVPEEFARLFDNIENPTAVTQLFMPALFRTGVDGWRVKEMKLSTPPKSGGELPYRLDDNFPWLRDVPFAKIGAQDYGKLIHLSSFKGFRAEVREVDEPCEGVSQTAERPVIMPQDRQCKPWGTRLGWLIGQPDATLNVLTFAMRDLSTVKVATLYRETKLREVAKGHWLRGEQYSWTPRMCFDGTCFTPELSEFGIWPKLQLYYAKEKRLVTVEPTGEQPTNSVRSKNRPTL